MLEVLFVCTGNICRSPLADAFLADRSRRLLDGAVRVRSAGTRGRRGHPAMPETVAVGRRRGVELEDHAASPLTAESIERADLVIGMTDEHRAEIVRVTPDAEARTFTLKELAALLGALDGPPAAPTRDAALARIAEAHRLRTGPGSPAIGDRDVADPLGFGDEVYGAVAWEIEEAVDAVVAGLFGDVARRAAAGEG